MQLGGYGFYFKGNALTATPGTVKDQDVLAQLQTAIKPVAVAPRPNEPAIPYKTAITSDVYFTNDKWQEVLRSHGIIVDAQGKTLTIQSSAEQADFVYDLKDEEVAKLTNNSLKEVPLVDRLRTINGVIQDDFKDAVTLGSLNSDKMLAIELHPEVKQDLKAQQKAVEQPQIVEEYQQVGLDLRHEGRPEYGATIDGRELYGINDNKAWFREGKHGREVEVGEISVKPQTEGKYTMTAVINGESITHEISQKDYDKFLAVNDFQRMKLFSKIFKEVDMKDIQSTSTGTKIGAGILAALTVGGALLGAGRGPRPEFYGGGPRPYFKPGVDSPEDVAARNFDAMMNQDHREPHRGL